MFKGFLFLLLLFSLGEPVAAQTNGLENDLKAAFIYNFTRYIDWEINNDENNFIIGVMGSSPIADALSHIAKTNMAKDKKIIIRIFNRPEEIEYCHILFIPEKNLFPLQAILDKVDKGVLTVSEEPGFARQGTAFNFVVINDKLKFEANFKILGQAGLKVSSQLLKLAIPAD